MGTPNTDDFYGKCVFGGEPYNIKMSGSEVLSTALIKYYSSRYVLPEEKAMCKALSDALVRNSITEWGWSPKYPLAIAYTTNYRNPRPDINRFKFKNVMGQQSSTLHYYYTDEVIGFKTMENNFSFMNCIRKNKLDDKNEVKLTKLVKSGNSHMEIF